MNKEIEIPEGYEARIEGDKIIIEKKESEDERIRKWLIEMVEEIRKANPNNAEHNGDCSEAIAYLERQKEQQPAEWSEEDQRACDGIIAILEAWDRSHTAPGGIQSLVPKYCLWLETHLKSLSSSSPQLHWKPSEEQMKSLSTAYRLGKLGKTDMEVLQSLHNDLKSYNHEIH